MVHGDQWITLMHCDKLTTVVSYNSQKELWRTTLMQ